MKTTIKAIILLLLLPVSSLAQTTETITLNLPESVMARTVRAVLPLDIDARSEGLQGTIRIIGIDNLQFGDKYLSCRLHVAGSDLRIVSELAGHQINLKVGEVEIDFNCNARLRFDPQRQILYVKPVVDMMNATQNGGQDDLGQALVALLNGREFPVSMQDMKPLIARSGGKTLMIAMRFVNIEARRDMLQFSLLPEVSTK
ncbi:MAG: hypothetical protein WBN83_01020 [Desulfoprunum sp.]|jgi:hypothetical protein|uniref:hypothetical protein n=1 Tax=Desulfoprunum sp. TaxID=2020866 RepID=UPI003C78A4A4